VQGLVDIGVTKAIRTKPDTETNPSIFPLLPVTELVEVLPSGFCLLLYIGTTLFSKMKVITLIALGGGAF